MWPGTRSTSIIWETWEQVPRSAVPTSAIILKNYVLYTAILSSSINHFLFVLPEIATTGADAEFSFEVKESEIVLKDKDTSNVTGVEEGETTVS